MATLFNTKGKPIYWGNAITMINVKLRMHKKGIVMNFKHGLHLPEKGGKND
jgi:hypothetical protein